MTLELTDIGMIKKASIKLDALTVIAGVNDTGKSTIGKTVLACVKAGNMIYKQTLNDQKLNDQKLNDQKLNDQKSKEVLARMFKNIFENNVSSQGEITLKHQELYNMSINIKDNNFIEKFNISNNSKRPFQDATLIQSPLVFDLTSFFASVAKMKQKGIFEFGDDTHISYPYILWDLYDKLSKENKFSMSKKQEKINETIMDIIAGEFKYSQNNDAFNYIKYLGRKPPLEIEMFNTAYGIKSFAILQLLNKNNYFRKTDFIIFDEPEVHLHPKWQIEMAKIIVMLAKNGASILVNSHSPYMIQALIKYSKEYGIEGETNFYLSSKTKEEATIEDVTNAAHKIFDLLAKPMADIYE